MPRLVTLVEKFLGKGTDYRLLQDGAIKTTTASGELMFSVLSTPTRFHPRRIQEQSYGGLAAAWTPGRLGRRTASSADDPRVVTAKHLLTDRSPSTDRNSGTLGTSAPTLHRVWRWGRAQLGRLIPSMHFPSMHLMCYVFAALALSVCASGKALAADYPWPVLRVVDGDTVAVDASIDLPPELARLNVRLRGVDTPEKGGRAKCPSERRAGQAATAFTDAAIAKARRILVRDPEWGKWGGRVVADLILDGRSLSEELIAAGHGRPFSEGRRGSWCH